MILNSGHFTVVALNPSLYAHEAAMEPCTRAVASGSIWWSIVQSPVRKFRTLNVQRPMSSLGLPLVILRHDSDTFAGLGAAYVQGLNAGDFSRSSHFFRLPSTNRSTGHMKSLERVFFPPHSSVCLNEAASVCTIMPGLGDGDGG